MKQLFMSSEASALPDKFIEPRQRIGHGFDLHRLEFGLPLVLCGVLLEHDRGCAAHSDGDAVYHTVTDAVLGALALPDIGQIFPDTDAHWKQATSDVFVRAARELMEKRGYRISNLDVTIILERPKLSPHKERMRENLVRLLGAPREVINIKAKTHEKVDSLGENRSVGCHAVVLLERVGGPDNDKLIGSSGAGIGTNAMVGDSSPRGDESVLERLYKTIESRRGMDASSSWTAKLFSMGRERIARKVSEEATEVLMDAIQDKRDRVIAESADLLYHLWVLLADMNIYPSDVMMELRKREGYGGIQEKQTRTRPLDAS